MRTLFTFLIATCCLCVCATKSYSQICGANVPTFNINFTGNPSGTFTVLDTSRVGNCCGTSSPDRCIHFSVILDSLTAAVRLDISCGALPPGSLFYQIDCGPQINIDNKTGIGDNGCIT